MTQLQWTIIYIYIKSRMKLNKNPNGAIIYTKFNIWCMHIPNMEVD